MESTRSERRPFVIFFQGRSGSTFLAEALDSHPNVRCEMERLVSLRRSGAGAQMEWIQGYLRGGAECPSAIGFKTKLDDVLNPSALAELLKRNGVQIILLTRVNVVKLVVSWFNCERIFERTGDWNQYPPTAALEPFEIDVKKFHRRLGLVLHGKARLESYARSLELPLMPISYEEILTNREKTICRVCDFLGVEPMALKGQCVKATNDDLRRVVANFDALHRRYEGTHYQRMLEEVLTVT
jgi:LPS sulfotransferase NodH